jgi:DNA-binding response OmpR family regulator
MIVVEDDQPRVALVVEDDWPIRDALVTEFRSEGWQVYEAGTALEAFVFLTAVPPVALLVTDIDLNSRTTGWHVAEAFRAVLPELAVIYTSGGHYDPSRVVNNSVYIPKPYIAPEVVAASVALIAR